MSDTRSPRRVRLLLVDNREDILGSWLEPLSRLGYEVLACSSVNEAKEMFRLHNTNIDVAAIDVRLTDDHRVGDWSGGEVAEAIDGAIPVVMMSDKDLEFILDRINSKRRLVTRGMFKGDGPERLDEIIQEILIRRVFVAHGHDVGAREDVVFALRSFGLEPIVLGETPMGGRTIIESIEDYSDVSCAIIVLTPDDLGKAVVDPADLPARPRARQNVILEWGFFVGRLGRKGGVIALNKGLDPADLPSNHSGVRYLQMDAHGVWRTSLANELRKAGIRVGTGRGNGLN